MGRLAEDRPEGAAEVGLGDVGHRRNGLDVERLRVGPVHRVAGAEQPAVQVLGVATHADPSIRWARATMIPSGPRT
jgi:hypothetical protein